MSKGIKISIRKDGTYFTWTPTLEKKGLRNGYLVDGKVKLENTLDFEEVTVDPLPEKEPEPMPEKGPSPEPKQEQPASSYEFESFTRKQELADYAKANFDFEFGASRMTIDQMKEQIRELHKAEKE